MSELVRETKLARRIGLFLVALVAMGGYWSPAFFDLEATGFGDWQWFHHMWEAGRVSIQRWHEPPLYNPFHCGGVPLWGNPQLQALAPTYWITALPFGTAIGHKLFLVLHAIVGWMGAYLLARKELRLGRAASTYAAAVWCASGFFAWHGSGGHGTFLAFYYGPALLLAWRRSAEDLRWCSAVAAWMALIVSEGGHYPFPYFVLWLGFDAAVRLVTRPRDWKGIVTAGLVSGVLTGLAGAFRFVPILLAVRAHPNEVPDPDFLTVEEMLLIFTTRTHDWSFPGHRWVWPEYGGYVGYGALALAAAGLASTLSPTGPAGRRAPVTERVWLVSGLSLFFLFTQGSASEHHPWPLLQELPFYRSIHVPSRFRVLLTLYIALLGAVAVDDLARRLWRAKHLSVELRVLLPWLLVAGLTADIVATNEPIVNRWDGPPIGARPRAERHHLVRGRSYFAEYASYPGEHVGTTECYDPIPWEVSPSLWTGDVPQARIPAAGAGTVVEWGRTSQTIWAEVDLARPTRVVMNTNYIDGWISGQGAIGDDEGRLAIDVARPGRQRVTARYAPSDVVPVVSVTAVGWALLVLIPWGITARRRRRYERSLTPPLAR